VLEGLGYASAEIDRLQQEGAVLAAE
jgi:hypothetical protein